MIAEVRFFHAQDLVAPSAIHRLDDIDRDITPDGGQEGGGLFRIGLDPFAGHHERIEDDLHHVGMGCDEIVVDQVRRTEFLIFRYNYFSFALKRVDVRH